MSEESLPLVLMSPSGQLAVFLTPTCLTATERPSSFGMVGLLRIDRTTLSSRHASRFSRAAVIQLESGIYLEISNGRCCAIWPIGFSTDSRYFAFAIETSDGVRVRLVDCQLWSSCELPVTLNASSTIFGEPPGCWVGATHTLAVFHRCSLTGGDGFDAPEIADTDTESSDGGESLDGRESSSRARQILTSQIGLIGPGESSVRMVGSGGLFRRIVSSPNGDYLLVTKYRQCAQAITDITRWPTYSEVWSLGDPTPPAILARSASVIARTGGEYGRPGQWYWHPTEPATLVWLAEHGGHEVVALSPPFDNDARVLYRADEQCVRFCWTTAGRLVVLERDPEGSRCRLVIAESPGRSRVLVSVFEPCPESWPDLREPWRIDADHAECEQRPIWNTQGRGDGLVVQGGDCLYVTSAVRCGGEMRLSIDMLDLTTGCRSRLHTSRNDHHERLVGFACADRSHVVLLVESALSAPSYTLASLCDGRSRVLLAPSRSPGRWSSVVRRSFGVSNPDNPEERVDVDVYLPPDALMRSARAVFLWIQPKLTPVRPTPVPSNRYLVMDQPSPLSLVFNGVGVVYRPPARLNPFGIGAPQTMIDELAKQLESVVESLVEYGVADRERIGVGGHCLGAYAVAMLLARTKLFRAGVASAGRYNLASLPRGGALTAHRPLHEVPAVFIDRSPLTFASAITAPLLLIHGEDDDVVPATESDELFRAIARVGGRCRYVRLPHEGHIYRTVAGRKAFDTELSAWCTRHLCS